jgi:hypothetical protein
LKIIDQLKDHLSHVREQLTAADDRMKGLFNDTSDFQLRLQGLQDNIGMLKRKRYVQEVIVDENNDRLSKQSSVKTIPSHNREADLHAAISQATLQGLNEISKNFKPISINIPNEIVSNALLPNDVYEAIDPHLVRDLPPIIGSREFQLWDARETTKQTKDEMSEITIGAKAYVSLNK